MCSASGLQKLAQIQCDNDVKVQDMSIFSFFVLKFLLANLKIFNPIVVGLFDCTILVGGAKKPPPT